MQLVGKPAALPMQAEFVGNFVREMQKLGLLDTWQVICWTASCERMFAKFLVELLLRHPKYCSAELQRFNYLMCSVPLIVIHLLR